VKAILTLLAVGGLVSGAARADWVMVQKVEGPGHSGEAVLKIKGDKMRSDSGPQVSTIIDGKTGDVITLMHARKNYLKMSGDAVKSLQDRAKKALTTLKPGAAAAADDAAAAVPKLAATGKTEKISGYDTEEYTADIRGTTIHYWIAKDFPKWADFKPLMLRMQSPPTKGTALSPADFPGMPVKTVIEIAGYKSTTTLVSVKEQAVDAAIFEIPADYKEVSMPQIGAPHGKQQPSLPHAP